jgi:hypothetical protein
MQGNGGISGLTLRVGAEISERKRRSLLVTVDQQNITFRGRQCDSQINGSGGLSNASLDVPYSDHRHTRSVV